MISIADKFDIWKEKQEQLFIQNSIRRDTIAPYFVFPGVDPQNFPCLSIQMSISSAMDIISSNRIDQKESRLFYWRHQSSGFTRRQSFATTT